MYITRPQWIHQVKFLCFDVDGTLYREVPEIWNAIQSKIYNRIMKQKHWDESRTASEFRRTYENLGSSTKVLESFGIDGQEFFTEAFEKFDFSKYVQQDKKLLRLINALKKQYRIGVLSNGNSAAVKKKLEAIGLSSEMFQPFLTTYEFGALKPDPAPFLKVIEEAGVRPEESVYIGDREETDILGAKAVGMRTIMVWSKSPEADLSVLTIYDIEKIFLSKKV